MSMRIAWVFHLLLMLPLAAGDFPHPAHIPLPDTRVGPVQRSHRLVERGADVALADVVLSTYEPELSADTPWWLNYIIWQGMITGLSTGHFLHAPLSHGRWDVAILRGVFQHYVKSHYEAIVAAAIAHQGSDFKDRPNGTNMTELLQLQFAPNSSVGIAQIKAATVVEFVPMLAGENLLNPETAVQVMAAKLEAADGYISQKTEVYGSISLTDRFMLMAIMQQCAYRSEMENVVDDFFEQADRAWPEMFEINRYHYQEQLRFTALHLDWLVLNGWQVPAGIDLDEWRRIAFEGDLYVD